MAYFTNFPRLQYEYGGETGQEIITNIFRRVAIKDNIKNNGSLFIAYGVKNGEKPEHVSDKIYGSEEHYWVILLMNEIHNVYCEWPLSEAELRLFVEKKYGVDGFNKTHHYVNSDGFIVSQDIIGSSPVSNYDHETSVNDSKRFIKILDPLYLDLVISEIETIVRA
jgi:hypothetical protein